MGSLFEPNLELRTIPTSNDCIHINEFTLTTAKKNKQTLHNPQNWHKFIIFNVHGLKRDIVLKSLMEFAKPNDLIPLQYTAEGKGAFFFARGCGGAIEKFCSEKLNIPNPILEENKFRMKIILKYSSVEKVKVNIASNVMKVLRKRFSNGVVVLNNFAKDADLEEFIALSQPKLMAFTLNLAKVLKPTCVKLWRNEITVLSPLEIFSEQKIASVDIRHNLVQDITELRHLKNLDITELWLEGNPLCEKYDEHSYVEQILAYCPKLQKLDGFLLRQNGFLSFRRNFLCNLTSSPLIDEFLQQYFTAFDSKDWQGLESMYNSDAIFSMTTKPLDDALPLSTNDNVHCGQIDILKLFSKLPWSEHDPYTFTVDLINSTEKSAIIVVTGVFREVDPSERNLYGFNRCFVLQQEGKDFSIVNEQLHVSNALSSQQATAFKVERQSAPSPASAKEENELVNTLAVITSLTKESAKLLLEECNFSMKEALILFLELYRDDTIPTHLLTDD